jgi:hypothetical protein
VRARRSPHARTGCLLRRGRSFYPVASWRALQPTPAALVPRRACLTLPMPRSPARLRQCPALRRSEHPKWPHSHAEHMLKRRLDVASSGQSCGNHVGLGGVRVSSEMPGANERSRDWHAIPSPGPNGCAECSPSRASLGSRARSHRRIRGRRHQRVLAGWLIAHMTRSAGATPRA